MILILHPVYMIGVEIVDVPWREDDDHERRTEGKYNSAYGMNDMLDVGCNVLMPWYDDVHEWHDDVHVLTRSTTWCIDTKHDMMYNAW